MRVCVCVLNYNPRSRPFDIFVFVMHLCTYRSVIYAFRLLILRLICMCIGSHFAVLSGTDRKAHNMPRSNREHFACTSNNSNSLQFVSTMIAARALVCYRDNDGMRVSAGCHLGRPPLLTLFLFCCMRCLCCTADSGGRIVLTFKNGRSLLKTTGATQGGLGRVRARLQPRFLTAFETEVIQHEHGAFFTPGLPSEFVFDSTLGGFLLVNAFEAANRRQVRHAGSTSSSPLSEVCRVFTRCVKSA